MKNDFEGLPCLVFALGRDKYAFHIDCITEITRVSRVNVLPEMPRHLLGLFPFRGRVVPLIDMKARLGLEDAANPHGEKEERTLIVKDGAQWLGLKVDAIYEIVPLRSEMELMPEEQPPDWEDIALGVYEWHDDRVLLLNFAAVIDPAQSIALTDWKSAVKS